MFSANLLDQLFSSVLVVNHQGEVVESSGSTLCVKNVFESPLFAPVASSMRAALTGSGFECLLEQPGGQFRLRGIPTESGMVLAVDEPPRNTLHLKNGSATSAHVDFLARNLRQGLWHLSPDGLIISANEWLAQWLGLMVQDILGRQASDFVIARNPISAARSEASFVTVDGVEKHAILTIADAKESSGRYEGTVEIITDVTVEMTQRLELVRETRSMSLLARQDGLTGLGNRLAFNEGLQKLKAGEVEFGLVVADIDGFKLFSEPEAAHLGDRALKEVARRLRGCIRKQDTAARIGRDSFAVLIPNASVATLEEVAFRIESTVDFNINAGAHKSFNVCVSIGAAHSTDGARDIFAVAEHTMRRRKKARRARLLGNGHLG